jgi:hypothetical protein
MTDSNEETISRQDLQFHKKWQNFRKNITVEPIVACYIMSSVLSGIQHNRCIPENIETLVQKFQDLQLKI